MPLLRRCNRIITGCAALWCAAVSSPGGVLGVAILLVAFLAAPAGAPAKSDADLLWATVNVCDSKKQPDVIGIRGSMPGTGKKGDMLMRFRVQYWSGKAWRMVRGDAADSGFLRAGSSRYKTRQAGVTFNFAPDDDGTQLLRGYVQFEWREDGKVVRRKTRITERGHRSAKGADPSGYTAGDCVVS